MSIFIQEVLGLIKRDKKKLTLDKNSDYFEFGKLNRYSDLNNKTSYTAQMEPLVIKWGDFMSEINKNVFVENVTITSENEGNIGYIPVYTDPSGVYDYATLKDSIITQNDINTIINVNGSITVLQDSIINGINIGIGGGNILGNTRVGSLALANNTLGSNNTAIGNLALRDNTTGNLNTATGVSALQFNSSGNENSAYGVSALLINSSGAQNSAFGRNALRNNTEGSGNAGFGLASLLSNSQGTFNTAIGTGGLLNAQGSNNVSLGSYAGAYTTSFAPLVSANNSIFIGFSARALADNQTNQIVIGHDATGLGANTTVLGNTGTTLTAIYGRLVLGTTMDNEIHRLQIAGSAFISQELLVFGSASISQDSTINGINIGRGGGNNITNTRVGSDSLLNNSTGGQNIGIGFRTLRANTIGNNNIAIGSNAMADATFGELNVAIGISSLQNNTTGENNIAIGADTLKGNTTGSRNICLGTASGRFIQGGSVQATNLTDSLFIGHSTRPLADNQTNQIVIGHNATGLGSNTIVLGNSSIVTTALRGKIGIGTTTPVSGLHIVGPSGPNFSSLIIQNSTYAPTGNIGGIGFTATDLGGLSIGRYGETFFLEIAPSGNIGIGTITPVASAQLQIDSTTRGFLPPRMTTTQINAIASPANGLVVYNTTLSTICFYNGTSWQRVTSTSM